MRKIFIALGLICVALGVWGDIFLKSPDGNLKVSFALTNKGVPTYSLSFKGTEIVRTSPMGFSFATGTSLDKGFKVDGVTRTECDSVWSPVWGENSSIRENYNGMVVGLSKGDRRMSIEFRAFNDGIGFRYIFPGSKDSSLS